MNTKPAKYRERAYGASVIFVLFCLAGCSRAPEEGPAPPPPTAKVSYPLDQPVTDYADFTGRTMAVESVKLRARVWGHLAKINFTEGADVKKDDVLFIIDQRTYQGRPGAGGGRAGAKRSPLRAACRAIKNARKA